ncbi:MAG: hypothetical protein DYG86_05865 [Chloroflexi bacterium CFX2]|nr:hypothetical protein [Chloroflexi bacterium CFX2]
MKPAIKRLREIGERHAKTLSQVALRWLIENPIVLPIPGAKNGKQAADTAEALRFSLTMEEVNRRGDVLSPDVLGKTNRGGETLPLRDDYLFSVRDFTRCGVRSDSLLISQGNPTHWQRARAG